MIKEQGDVNMATMNDFQQKQRERQRRQRARAQRNRRILIGAVLLIVIIIVIAIISSCSRKKQNDQNLVPQNANNELVTTEAPATEAPATEAPVSAGVKNIPSPDEENDLVEIIETADAENYAYLTFDDGPNTKITPQILDILRRYNVKATFFQVGSYIRQNSDIARRTYEEGHLIASHSDSHDYDKLYATRDSFTKELNDSYDAICEITGEEPFKLFRFPGGSYNAGDHASEKQEYKKVLSDMGFYYADWNSLNGDAEGRTKDADGLIEFFKDNQPKKGTNLVILMHDAMAKQATADALPRLIEYLMDEGYSFHRMDDIPYSSSKSSSGSSSSSSSSKSNDSSSSSSSSSSKSNDSGSSSSSSSSKSTAKPTSTPSSSDD